MGALHITRAGAHTSIQDSGRPGWGHLGVPEGGASDRLALAIGNALLGNPADAAALEIYIGGFEATVEGRLQLCMSGSVHDCLSIRRGSDAPSHIPCGVVVDLFDGDSVQVPPLQHSYGVLLCCAGTFNLPRLYGSLSTTISAGIGGLDGRLLAAGDCIAINPPTRQARQLQLDDLSWFARPKTVRVVLGPQQQAFKSRAIDDLFCANWQVTPRISRMGMALSGPKLSHRTSADVLSDGVVYGSIQVAADGQPLILMADHATMGGYSKIATVISVDLSPLARLAPGGSVQFEPVNVDYAIELRRAEQEKLRTLLDRVRAQE